MHQGPRNGLPPLYSLQYYRRIPGLFRRHSGLLYLFFGSIVPLPRSIGFDTSCAYDVAPHEMIPYEMFVGLAWELYILSESHCDQSDAEK